MTEWNQLLISYMFQSQNSGTHSMIADLNWDSNSKLEDYLPCSTHSLAGKMALRMSSCFGLFSRGGKVPLFLDANQRKPIRNQFAMLIDKNEM